MRKEVKAAIKSVENASVIFKGIVAQTTIPVLVQRKSVEVLASIERLIKEMESVCNTYTN